MDPGRYCIDEIIYVPPYNNWHFPLHEHDNVAEISLVIQGKGTFYCDNKEWEISRGTLIVKNPGLAHAEKSDTESPMEQICISVRKTEEDETGVCGLIPLGMSPVMDMTDHFPILSECFSFLRTYYGQTLYERACQSILDSIMEIIFISVHLQAPRREVGKKKGEAAIREIKAYIDENYRQKITLEGLSSLFFISVGYLSRQFKQYTGFTVNQYVINKRMGAAQKMLLFGDQSVKEIASACGYSDLQYFYNVFRRFANCTPIQFREMYGKNPSSDHS